MIPEISLVRVDMADLRQGGDARQRAIATLGDALAQDGFFAITGHGFDEGRLKRSYEAMQGFFALEERQKLACDARHKAGQRGYTPFGVEQAKDALVADLKEFFQIGRVDVPDDHMVHVPNGPNVWPEAPANFRPTMEDHYAHMVGLGDELLAACAEFLGEAPTTFSEIAQEGDTVLRLIHYPPVMASAEEGATRAAAHEDINLITLLCGSTSEGLQLQQHDGSWVRVRPGHQEIVVDTGDMMQNLTNGIFRSTTHRVVVPDGGGQEPRYSMPMFVHPRADASLGPLEGCIARTGGKARFPDISAGDYLAQRLREIGLKSS